ncbi:hypothetical protein OHB26_16395 [Nocardia sp. NBC_01503]|uniref:hypothetical protein n=1 Tax=Nocardia sp. NBC_01503 TaxID=2975997 RepID=UPI002E7C0B75|nr:hypothetical protein [Nocardia sp. NBC_01503]WTL35631.1 hypothetical protein OHB26_16395 [Nocardia sp. NBC_01503]
MGVSYTMQLMNLVTTRLTEAMVAAGFVESEPLDGRPAEEPATRNPQLRRLWFTLPDSGIRGMSGAIGARLTREPGRVGIQGQAWVGSAALGELAERLPPRALTGAEFDSVPFGYFDDRFDPFRELYLGAEVDVEYVVGKFMQYVQGPAAEWLGDRDSLAKLFDLARKPNMLDALDGVNPDPPRLRGAVLLNVLNGQPDLAASLMTWYLARDQFHHWDSTAQVVAFDLELAQQYPAYAQARGAGQ